MKILITRYYIKNILEKFYCVSLYTKMLGLVIFVAMFIGISTIFTVKKIFYDFNSNQLQEISLSLSKELSYQSVNYLLDNNIFGLTRILVDAKESNTDVLYAFIESPNKKIVASTFGNVFPMELLSANNFLFVNQSTEEINTNKGTVIDTSMPILKGNLGVVRVGISTQRSRNIVNNLIYYILLIVIAAILFSIIFVSIISWIVMRPVTQLTKATTEIPKGNFNFKINSPKYKDDIGKLVESFNAMIDKLKVLEYEKLEKEHLLKEFVNKTITVQEDERKRIARELHDEFGQFFAFIKINLKLIEDALSKVNSKKAIISILSNLKDQLNKEVVLIHNMAKDLRPTILDELGLSRAVEFYLNDFVEKHYNITLDYQTFNVEKRRFEQNIETNVYRVIQEAVLNVTKHSKATFLKVFLEWNNGILRGIIEDNGVGFDLNKKNSSFGIYGMQERVFLLKGTIEISSENNVGTMIAFSVPT